MSKINILGVNIDNISKKELDIKISEFLQSKKQRYIVTPNPEIILEAQKDEEFFYILNSADLAIADGIGLKFASFLFFKNLQRITGVYLTKLVLKKAQELNKKVLVFNWQNGLSSKQDIENFLKKYKNLKFFVLNVEREFEMPYYKEANLFQPDIIFSNFGAPYQEKFIYHFLQKNSYANLGLGVGGAFDYLTKRVKRAPKFFRFLGLEWLFRLYIQPKRIKRIYNAVIVFPLRFLKFRFILPFLYRPNVLCVLYKKDKNEIKVLLVRRVDQENHWQLPQGGTDGEDVKSAGIRELSEELNIYNFKPVKVVKNIYKYKFGDKIGKFNTKTKVAMGYKGQKQSLLIAKFYGKDSEIKVNFWDHDAWKWVNLKDLPNEVDEVRKPSAKIVLKELSSAKLP